MKHLVILFSILYSGESFSQKVSPENACDSTLNAIYLLLSQSTDYSEEEAKTLGLEKAKCDILAKKKSIIVFMGMFSDNHCEQCFYSEHGFDVQTILVSDVIISENQSHAFVKAYNEQMNVFLTDQEKQYLQNIKANNSSNHSVEDISQTLVRVTSLNDSTINVRISNSIIEQQFNEEISNLKLKLTLRENGFEKECFYNEINGKGVELIIPESSKLKLQIEFNFDLVENCLDHCWCTALQHDYRVILPITVKD